MATPRNKVADDPYTATAKDVKKASKEWDDAVLDCRLLGHSWQGLDAQHVKKYRYWYRTFRCTRKCGCIRWEELSDRTGLVFGKGMIYPTDEYGKNTYLMPKGTGRITGELRGVLRLEALRRMDFVEVTGEDAESHPHSSHTVIALQNEGLWPQ
jgi:hypothetical protein